MVGEANDGEWLHVTAYLLEKGEWPPLFWPASCVHVFWRFHPREVCMGLLDDVQVGAPEAKAPANYLLPTYSLLFIVLKVLLKFVTPLGSAIQQF